MASEPDSRERVLIVYGDVMSIVQQWELALMIVWWRMERKHKDRPSGDFDTQSSQKEIYRLEAAVLRMTAQSVKDDVAPHLEVKTGEDLKSLIDERNRLAHRFLRERVTPEGQFEPGTRDELAALARRFLTSLRSVMNTIESFDAYEGPVLKHWPELAERLVEGVFRGQRIPRDPNQQ